MIAGPVGNVGDSRLPDPMEWLSPDLWVTSPQSAHKEIVRLVRERLSRDTDIRVVALLRWFGSAVEPVELWAAFRQDCYSRALGRRWRPPPPPPRVYPPSRERR